MSFILITGASSGIGRATAIKLSVDHNLIIHGRDKDRLEDCRKACLNSDQHVVWPCDFTNANIPEDLAALLELQDQKVSGFVHCAGTVKVLPTRSIFPGTLSEIMQVNFNAAVIITSTLLKKRINKNLLKNIVFVSSVWSRRGSENHSIYCASKGALDAFMRSIAVELAPKVRVNSVLPGAVKTPMADKTMQNPAVLTKLTESYPLGIGEAEDIANMIDFLFTDNSRWITGQEMIVDGGFTCH